MTVIFESFDGVELKDLGDDKRENTALAVALVTVLRRHMKTEKNVDYIPTAIDFIQTVQFSNVETEGNLLEVPIIDPPTIDQYVSDIAQATGAVALKIKEKIPDQQDAYLILSLLSSLCLFSYLHSTFRLPEMSL